MKKTDILILLVMCSLAPMSLSCSARSTGNAEPRERSQGAIDLEAECETQLAYLQEAIATLAPGALSVAASVELKELYLLSQELYLRGDYSEALLLIEEALSLIKERGD